MAHTTFNRFQRNRDHAPAQTRLDGAVIGSTRQAINNRLGNWIIDPYNTGYYLAPGNDTLHVEQGDYLSPDQSGRGYNRGNSAKAWLQHGDPTADNAGYEYLIQPATNPDAMKAVQQRMKGATPYYRVLQKDANAHLVSFDTSTQQREAYVIFSANHELNPASRYLLHSDTPILAIASQADFGNLQLSLVNPELKLSDIPDLNNKRYPYGNSLATQVRLTLKGRWQLRNSTDPDVSLRLINGNTELTLHCRDGMPVDSELSLCSVLANKHCAIKLEVIFYKIKILSKNQFILLQSKVNFLYSSYNFFLSPPDNK